VAGIGMGCVIGPLGPVTLARADRRHAGVAGGIHSAAQQVGGALGAAIVGSVFFAALGSLSGEIAFAWAVAATGALLVAVAALAAALPARIFD
jgi:predicted MFS family arabinose efflux permease